MKPMSSWRIAVLVLGVISCVGCSPETASPPPGQTAPPPTPTPQPAPAPEVPADEPTTTAPTTVTNAPAPQTPRDPAPALVPSFAVYTLSRGKGVPDEAREALRRVVEHAEEQQRRGVKVQITTTRIGIEGETRACIAYEDPQEGARAYENAKNIVKNVDLVNLTIEPCVEEKES